MRCLVLALFTQAVVFAQVDLPSSVPHVQAELTNNIKTKKAKVGDKVRANTEAPLILPNGTAVPVPSTLFGHVSDVTNSETGSSVTIVFDQVEINNKKGPVNFSIRAAMMPGVPQTSASGDVAPRNVQLSEPMHGRAQTVQDAAQTVQVNPAAAGADSAAPSHGKVVAAQAGTVIGMPGVTLLVDDTQHTSKFQSSAPNLELRSGLKLMLAVVE